MSQLHRIAKAREEPAKGSVVFVHGLAGDPFKTWQHDARSGSSWPQWIADSLPRVDVFSLGYDASPSDWLGTTMPLFDRAKQVLAWLEEIAHRPMILVGHSMGGLLAKELVRHGITGGVDEWKSVAEQIKGIAFLATPHVGADLAGVLNKLGKVLRTTVSLEELEKNEPYLRQLNEWFRNNAPGLGLSTISFYETRRIGGALVVDASTADPGIQGAASIPLDADHISICKPDSREGLLHTRVRRFVEECIDESATGEGHISPGAEGHPAKLFVSYKRNIPSDSKLAEFLCQGFRTAGHEVFIDVTMVVGTDWVDEIARRIDWCDYLVVLLSEPAVQSEMVQAEVRLAHQNRRSDGKPAILPIRVNYGGPLGYELDAYLSRIQFVTWAGSQDSARVLAKLREAIEVASTRSPNISSSLDELDAAAPDDRSRDRRRPSAAEDPRVLIRPGGTIKINDEFYVRRDADELIDGTAQLNGETLVIKAARQMGKSSLLIRYLAACKHFDKQFAFIDFQSFSEEELGEYSTLLRGLGHILLRAFRLDADPGLAFDSQRDFTNFVEDKILKPIGAPVTIAMDEVDRVLGRPYQGDFFSMLRLWHNERAKPFSPWEDVDLALVIATEPYLLIDKAEQSPFNVSPAIELGSFERAALDEINESYGSYLEETELDQLYELLNGHPYLSRLAFYRLLAPPGLAFRTLMAEAFKSDGTFGDHLRSRLFLLRQQPELLAAMRQVIAKGRAPNDNSYYRLHGAGLVEREGTKVVPANLLYAGFFRQLQ